MKTKVFKEAGQQVEISHDLPVVVIGEKINPTGKPRFGNELLKGDLSTVQNLAIKQAQAGAHIIDVNIGFVGVDEVALLPAAVKVVMETTELPIAIDSSNPKAVDMALAVFRGKAILNSITGEEKALEQFLPIVKHHGCAVIALCYDDDGISNDPQKRLAVAQKIINRAIAMGIPAEDIIIDPLALPVATATDNAAITLATIRLIKTHLDHNITLGVSNTSFGLPDRKTINTTMLVMAIAYGVNCPIIDITSLQNRKAILAANLITGKDEFARQWIQAARYPFGLS